MENLLNPSTLIAGFVFGVIGFWLFREGKKKQNMYILVIGILMMAYPYFIDSPVWTWIAGGLLCLGAWLFWYH